MGIGIHSRRFNSHIHKRNNKLNDTNYAGNFMYMNSEHIESRLDIDYFKNIDTREYIKVYN